jgi:hypothetical protein
MSKLTNLDFIERSKKMGVFDEYIFLDKYVNNKTPIRAIHKVCGNEVSIIPREWFRGKNRCRKCTINKKWRKPEISIENEKAKINSCLGNNYKLIDVSFLTKHGKGSYYAKILNLSTKEYKTVRADHITSDKRYLSSTHIKSVGELRIKSYLERCGIDYVSPKTFEGLKDKQKLHYDFYLPNNRVLIEYQGEQHFNADKQISCNPHAYELQVKHDEMKRSYAKNNNYTLYEIPYTIYSYSEIYRYMNKLLN